MHIRTRSGSNVVDDNDDDDDGYDGSSCDAAADFAEPATSLVMPILSSARFIIIFISRFYFHS